MSQQVQTDVYQQQCPDTGVWFWPDDYTGYTEQHQTDFLARLAAWGLEVPKSITGISIPKGYPLLWRKGLRRKQTRPSYMKKGHGKPFDVTYLLSSNLPFEWEPVLAEMRLPRPTGPPVPCATGGVLLQRYLVPDLAAAQQPRLGFSGAAAGSVVGASGPSSGLTDGREKRKADDLHGVYDGTLKRAKISALPLGGEQDGAGETVLVSGGVPEEEVRPQEPVSWAGEEDFDFSNLSVFSTEDLMREPWAEYMAQASEEKMGFPDVLTQYPEVDMDKMFERPVDFDVHCR